MLRRPRPAGRPPHRVHHLGAEVGCQLASSRALTLDYISSTGFELRAYGGRYPTQAHNT